MRNGEESATGSKVSKTDLKSLTRKKDDEYNCSNFATKIGHVLLTAIEECRF